MNAIRKDLSGLDDGHAVGADIDAINAKFAALRDAMDKAIDGPADARKDAAKKIVADNAVFNAAVTALLDEQVRRMAMLNGDAYRQASLRQHRQDAARRRRSQLQPAQEPRRREGPPPRLKRWKQPLAGPQRPDRDVAAGPARQSGDAGQRGGGAGEDERS